MCGIAGIVSPHSQQVQQSTLQTMANALAHRGPQGEGFWINAAQSLGFGHRRLSIIDTSAAGAQPMNYGGRYTITYNGEIYNYIELRETLQQRGYTFTSHCDTEVLLAAYACWGKDCLQQLDGMFAFALWDEQERTLFCARDRFGEKPFYYHYDSVTQTLHFASEMKALWAAGIPRHMRNDRLLNYLTLGWVQNPVNSEQTFFQDIYSLPPSHYLLLSFRPETGASFSILNYWDIDKETTLTHLSDEAINNRFLELLTNSVKRRLRSDVPVGSSLSGGLDSSSVVALIRQVLPQGVQQQTFSAIFPGFDKDESAYIREVTNRFDLANYTITPTAEDFVRDFATLVHHQEEPFQSASIYAQYCVYRLAAQHGVTVILDGQGADETLAGYTKYYHWYWQELASNKQWHLLKEERNFAAQNGAQVPWGISNYVAAFMPQLAANRLEKKALRQQNDFTRLNNDFVETYRDKHSIYKPAVAKLNDLLYFNTMQFGLEELLRYADRNSMAHSREVRLPFLNHELVQFVFSLPANAKLRRGFSKFVLRKTMETQLPENIVWRKDKVGFEPPQQQWMAHPSITEQIMESRKKLVQEKILRPSVLKLPGRQQSAHEGNNFDWWYLCATRYL